MTSTLRARKGGLDWTVPESGSAADACEVARTAAVLMLQAQYRGATEAIHLPARHATRLHVISGRLWAIATREANGYRIRTVDNLIYGGATEAIHLPARHATRLHVISGKLQRIGENLCNFSYTCPKCDGGGQIHDRGAGDGCMPCPACAGHGHTLGRRLESLRQDAREIAEHYGLRCYFQSDPRGCALYIYDPATIPMPETAPHGNWKAAHDARWIDANYTRGHAVVRLGR